MSPLKVAN